MYHNLAVGKTLWVGLRRDDKYDSKLDVKLIYVYFCSACNISNYKITELLRALFLVDSCVKLRVCKDHDGCDVLDSPVFLRNIL